jgi:hypothetical protein
MGHNRVKFVSVEKIFENLFKKLLTYKNANLIKR